MEEVTNLEKRHGSAIHVEVANIFALLVFLVICVYSLLEVVNAKYKKLPRRLMVILRSPIFLTLLWGALISWGVLHHLNTDLRQIARRYGQLAMAMSTVTVFLSLKPAVLPRTYQVSLVTLHKWIGRSGILCAAVHGFIYFYSYARKAASSSGHHDKRHGGHKHKLFSLYNIFGMICLLAFLTIFVSSLGPVRRKSYAVFYMLHRPLVILVYVLMVWHARPSSWLLVPMGMIFLALQVGARLLASKRVHVSEVKKYGPSLKLVTFDPPISETMLHGPGSHVRISKPLYYPTTFFRPSHPYSLVGTNQLVVRESRFKLIEGDSYSLYGPFSTSFVPEHYTHIVVFAGGSGVSLLPSFAQVSSSRKLVWVTRSAQEIPVLSDLGLEDCDVYVSNSREKGENSGEDSENFELQEFEIDSDDDAEANVGDDHTLLERRSTSGKAGIQKFPGRPNIGEIVNRFYGEQLDSKARLCVIACGPEQLVSDVSSWAATKQYDLWTEVFAL